MRTPRLLLVGISLLICVVLNAGCGDDDDSGDEDGGGRASPCCEEGSDTDTDSEDDGVSPPVGDLDD